MWSCPTCGRIFEKTKQIHSCKSVALEKHFKDKTQAKELFEYLVKLVDNKIGKCKVVSLPCCVHLFGKYDFLAALPKKDGLEIRFALNHTLNSPKLKVSVPMSSKVYKNCFDIHKKEDLDDEFIGWVKHSYFLKG